MDSQVALVVENPPANAGDKREVRLIPASRGSTLEGCGNRYSHVENPMDREEPDGLQSMGLQGVGHN